MLAKFETKSARVKGVAFHARRPWVLSGLHSGAVQLWDYRLGALVEQWDAESAIGAGGTPTGATGPVRAVAFHPSQALFAAGSDDGKVRVYDARARRCLFVLSGHTDYVRSVSFHAEHPWLASASDDQTVRVWNWQSRACVSVLAGHAHYVMCASFHPTEDLLVSASLDGTARVWDLSNLRRRGSSSTGGVGAQGVELFGSPEGSVRFVLEGHERGVNWAVFHPSGRPVIATSSDDRTVRLWRYSEARAWETDVLRGFGNNVSSVVFSRDGILADSEDRTVRLFDVGPAQSGRRPGTVVARREHERFWSLAAHPEDALYAAGHDGGLLVFKLGHERVCLCAPSAEEALVVRGARVYAQALPGDGPLPEPVCLAVLPSAVCAPATLTHSAADSAALVVEPRDGGAVYTVAPLRPGTDAPSAVRTGGCVHAALHGRNRLVLLHASAGADDAHSRECAVTLCAFDGAVLRTVAVPRGVQRVFVVGAHTVAAERGALHVVDFARGAVSATLTLPSAVGVCKYAAAHPSGDRAALYSSRGVAVVASTGGSLSVAYTRTPGAKSAAWDNDVLYTTDAFHLRYAIVPGDSVGDSAGKGVDDGVVCTLQAPLYLVGVAGTVVRAYDRRGAAHVFRIDTAEPSFKRALRTGDAADVSAMLARADLVGQAALMHVRRAGHAALALRFVRDAPTRLELAADCGAVDAIVAAAAEIGAPPTYVRAADALLACGAFGAAAESLALAGDRSRAAAVRACAGLARAHEDGPGAALHAALLAGDAEALSDALQRTGDDRARAIARLVTRRPSSAASPVAAWPRTRPSVDASRFSPKSMPVVQSEAAAATDSPAPRPEDAGGWGDLDIAHDLAEPRAAPGVHVEDPEMPAEQVPVLFDPRAAMRRALAVLAERHAVIADGASAEAYARRAILATTAVRPLGDGGVVARASALDAGALAQSCADALGARRTAALAHVTAGRFHEARAAFAAVIADAVYGAAAAAAAADTEPAVDVDAVREARDYVLGLGLEALKKRSAADAALCVAAAVRFAALPRLRPEHTLLALRSALAAAYRASCPALAARLAHRLLALAPADPAALKVVAAAERLPLSHTDAFAIAPDALVGDALAIDAVSLMPVDPACAVACGLCGALHAPEHAARPCAVCAVARVSSPNDEF